MVELYTELPALTQAQTPQPAKSKCTEWKVLEEPLGTKHHVRIITIGAGASGINAIRTLSRHLENFDHVVYEKNADVGGTWYENRYPGCRCDIPSHNYQFAWKPNPSWTSFYSDAREIYSYFRDLCTEEHLLSSIKLFHAVVHAKWNEEEGLWHVKVKNLQTSEVFEDSCNFLLDGSGILNNWKWPNITGIDEFKGELIHSANWPDSFKWKGKKVALIGNGSSGVQILPAIRPDVQSLKHFVRSAIWVVPPGVDNMRVSTAGEVVSSLELDGIKFTDNQIKAFQENPEACRKFVKATEKVLVNGSAGALKTKESVSVYMKAMLRNDQRLTDILIPNFPVGCRRITPVIIDSISSIDETGLWSSTGEHFDVDAIICATGFDVSFCPRFPIIGRTGNLQNIWRKELPKAYMSCTVPDMPNYFMFLSPNAPIGHGSVLTITEHVAKYMAKLIDKCQTQGIKAIVPKRSAVDQFAEYIEKFMPRTAWAGECRSWFKNGELNGPVTALYPGSRIHWFHMLEQFRGEDYDYVSLTPNISQYLGNGFSTREGEGHNSTWYIDEPDRMF